MGRLTHPLLTALILAALAGVATAAPRPGGRAAPPDSFVFYQIPIDGDGPAARVAVSAMRPGARIGSALPRSTGPLNALADPDTTYEWFEHGFDRAAGGLCGASGWTGQDRSSLVFAHVDNKHLTNNGSVTMGGKALWFGTDLATNPSEVAMWYYPEGFGANWSQRLTSPTFTNGNYRLTFDGQVGLQAGSGLLAGAVNRYLGVQALRADGKWGMLSARWVGSNGALLTTSAGLRTSGTATFRCYVPTHPDSQSAFPFATPTQLRIVVETQSITSNEDGGVPLQPCPGAIVDNVSLEGINSPASPLPLHDFEDGTTGVWTLSARNGGNNGAVNVIRDFPAPTTDVSLKQGFDPIDPSCVWQVAGPSGVLEDGTFARITSPWIAWEAGSDTAFSVVYRGSLPPDALHQGRLMNLRFRGKNAGDTYARRFYARPGVLYYGAGSSDLDTPVGTVSEFSPYPGLYTAIGSVVCDSIQIAFEVTDQCERFSVNPASRLQTRHPIFDDLRIVQYHEDADFDGIRNSKDPCSSVCAAGQDANGDGCVDATATLRHVESWPASASPLHFRLSQHGDPAITDGSDLQALRNGFAAWAAVTGANVQVVEDPVTSQTDASATDGVNLLTFEDDYAFPGNVLAITPTLSFTKRTSFDDRIRLPGEIVDADILFNPAATFRTATAGPTSGSFDLQSVATHEIGHFLGLSHSGVADATMFPVLQSGTLAASLESDDKAAIAAAYPGATLLTSFGWISGRVTRGGNGDPIPGALVIGVLLDGGGAPQDTVASDYTDEAGYYHLYRLPAGDYAVRVMPLDGSIPGVVPGAINARVAASAVTNFQPEWYGGPESNSDDPDVRQAIAVAAGSPTGPIDIVTNIDVTPPTVASVSPADMTGGVRIDTPILVTFSEPVDANTIGAAFKLHVVPGSGTLGGHGELLAPGVSFVFVPDQPLLFATDYQLQLTTALKDVQGNPIAATTSSTFTTEPQPPVSIADLSPRQAPVGALVSFTGAGYDASVENRVYFSTSQGFAGYVLGTLVTPTSLAVEVPSDAVTGPVKVEVAGVPTPSNLFSFTLLTSTVAAPSPNGAAVATGFPPTDVALSPDAKTAFAVGAQGFVRINLDPLRPFLRQAQPAQPALVSCAHLALNPSGLRAYVSRPDLGEVVEMDTDPNSGTFGLARATIALTGRPDGVAVSPSGQRAYVTDAATGAVVELDVDAGSATYRHALREIAVPGADLTGGIAIDARRDRLVLATRNLGVVTVDLDTTSIITTVSASPAAGGVAVAPGGNQVLATSPDPSTGRVVFGSPIAAQAAASVDIGGDARDVAVDPDGATAFVANAVLGRLQVLDVTQPTPILVANVATGGTPVAVAVSANGALAATADFAGQSVSLYNIVAGTPTPVRAVPPVAVRGDRVAVPATGGALNGGTLVDLGSGGLPAVHAVPSAVAFTVPAGEPRAAAVTLVNGGVRSLSTVLQIVDPIDVFDPRATGVALDPQNVSCGVGSVDGALARVVVSPDGTRLAVTRQGPACALVDVYQVVPDLAHVLGARLVDGAAIPGATALNDLAFTPDGKKVWVAADAGGLFELDVDLATVLAFGGGTVGTAHALATDPMGRYVVVGAHVNAGVDQVQLWSPGRTLGGAVGVTGEVHALAMSPDGHYAIAGAEGRAHIVDVSAATLVASTPLHALIPPDRLTSVAVTTDGRRAAGVYPGNAIAIWNLDPLAGAVGAELFYDASSLPGTISQLVPAPDGDAMLAGCADCSTLFSFEPATPPPAGNGPLPGGAALPLGQRSRALARSVDGRSLWVADWTDGTLLGDVKAFTLTRGTTLALVSGAGQSASPSQPLPLPVRVHLIADADGHDAEGALIRFSLAGSGQGTLDGGALEVVKPTGITGEAEVVWTMPATASPVSLSVAALGVSGASLTVDAEAVADPSVAVPTVVGVGPANGATGIDASTSIFVRFSQRIAPGSVDSGAVLVVNGAVAGRATRYEDQERSVFVTPTIPLAYSARCSLYLPAGLRDQEGQLLPAPLTSVFTVQAPPVLAIHSVSPPSAPVGCPITINGDGFSSIATVNGVSLNGLLTPVATASTGALVTTVLAGATSGPLTVTVGATTSAPFPFVVLPANPTPLQVAEEENVRSGIQAIALTPDGSRAYITLPGANCVLAYDLVQRRVMRSVAVGLRPQAIAITPDGHYAYVANSGSDNVSVIDVDPASPSYHQTLSGAAYPIRVGHQPRSLAVSAFGPTILVVNGDGTLSVIDAEPTRGTFDRVTKTIATGSTGTAIVLTVDGAHAYVATDGGILVVDVESQAVTTTIKVGSGVTNVAITVDGTVLFALDHNGFLNLIDIAPGSTSYNEVTKAINVGAGATAVAISIDGTLLYVTMQDTNVALGFQIFKGAGGGPGGSVAPGPATTLTLVDTVAVGEAPGAIAMFPSGLGGMVVNEASGTVSFLGSAITIGVEPKPAPAVALALLIHPTPSHGPVTLRFALPTRTRVDLDIFDVQGRLVRQVVHETMPPGWHAVEWDGADRSGAATGTGVYLVRLRAEGRELHRRIVRLR